MYRYVWSYSVLCTYSGNCSTVIHNYESSGAGTYTATLNVSNKIGTFSLSKTYTLQKRVGGTKLVTAEMSIVRNVSSQWTIDFGFLGTDACYFLDFADPGSGKRTT